MAKRKKIPKERLKDIAKKMEDLTSDKKIKEFRSGVTLSLWSKPRRENVDESELD